MVYKIKLNQCVADYYVYGIYTMHLCLRQLLFETQSQHIFYLAKKLANQIGSCLLIGLSSYALTKPSHYHPASHFVQQ